MLTIATKKDRQFFNRLATHPLQTWAWGEFRSSPRVEIVRLIDKDAKNPRAFQISFHHLPGLPFSFGYCPKSVVPSGADLAFITSLAQTKRAIFVKFEPNVLKSESYKTVIDLKSQYPLVSGRTLFTPFTFWLNLTPTEEEIFMQLKSKTRYNIRLSEKKGVTVVEDNSIIAFKDYWRLTENTTRRQGFYAHNQQYHLRMWKTMHQAGYAHLFKAVYRGQTLVTWILFLVNGILYYPYGASSDQHRDVMASNLIMWEAIKFGKNNGARLFDLWGSAGPDPKEDDPWIGFHRFKLGYTSNIVEFVGTLDLVTNPLVYYPYRLGEFFRWKYLRLAANLKH